MPRLTVVTGGGTGIGRAVARGLALSGDEVLIVGRRADVLTETADQLNVEVGGSLVRSVAGDLTDPDQVDLIGKQIAAAGRSVDVLVNNAGGNFAPAAGADLPGIRQEWLTNLAGNILPTVLITAALLPMMSRPGGRIITITSIAAFRGPATYGGAKAALHPWSAELATRLAQDGIAVNVVAPGYVTDTEFYGDRMSVEFHDGRSRLAPMQRGGTPDEIAATVAHLASPAAGFITGQIIQINGGQLLGRG